MLMELALVHLNAVDVVTVTELASNPSKVVVPDDDVGVTEGLLVQVP